MHRFPLISVACLSLVLLLGGCAHHATICACDPCGCKTVAASLLEGVDDVPRPKDDLAAKTQKGAPEKRQPGVEEKLNRARVKGLQWEEASMDQAVQYLRTITGVSFMVSPKVREEKFEDVVYNLHLDDVSVSTVVELMTEPFGLRSEVREDVVWILTDEEIGGPKRLRYYDVKDLIGEGLTFASGEEAIEYLRREVEPSYWEDESEAVMEARNGILITRASRGVLDKVDDQLGHLRREQLTLHLDGWEGKDLEPITVHADMKAQPLMDTLKTFQIMTGLNMVVDPRIAHEVGQMTTTPVKQKDWSLLKALEWLRRQAGKGAVWTAKGRVLILTRAEFLDGQ